MTATLVATPDPQCTCGFRTTHVRNGHQWVFRRDPACPVHRRSDFELTTSSK